MKIILSSLNRIFFLYRNQQTTKLRSTDQGDYHVTNEINSEHQYDFMSHDNHGILVRNLDASISDLPISIVSFLYANLARIGQPLTSSLMHKIYSKLKNSMFEMDVISISDFASGCINQYNLNTDYILYSQSVNRLTRNLFQGFFWR